MVSREPWTVNPEKMEQTQVREFIRAELEHRIMALNKQFADLEDARNNETKSSAGDKYETSREMMQREADQISERLHQAKDMLEQLNQLPQPGGDQPIQLGHLVETDRGWLFLAIPFGKCNIDGQTCFALSPSAPLGQKLLGKKAGQSVQLGKIRYTIEKVL